MNANDPASGTAFLGLDIDNLVHYDFSCPNDVFDKYAMLHVLTQIQQHTGLTWGRGYASMNRSTSDRLPMAVLNVLSDWRINVNIVRDQPEAADKDLFYAFGRAVGLGFRTFLIVSKDKGFTEVAHRIRNDVPDTHFVVIVDRLTTEFRDLWSRFEGAPPQFLELQPGRSTLSPSNGQATSASALPPRPGQAVAASIPPEGSPSPPQRAPTSSAGPRLSTAGAARPQDNFVLICTLCGRRSLQKAVGLRSRCRNCGASMKTDAVFSRLVVPAGKVPYQDGPVLEIYFEGQLRRAVVLCGQCATFGRLVDETNPTAFGLADLVKVANRVSGQQFMVANEGNGWVLRNVGSRPMFDANHESIVSDQPLPLVHEQEFWLNNIEHERDAGALLKFVFRTQRRDGEVERRATP